MGKTLKYIFVFIAITVVGFEIGYLSDQIDFSRLLSGWKNKNSGIITKTYELKAKTDKTTPVFTVKFFGVREDRSEIPLDKRGLLWGDGTSGIVLGEGKRTIVWTPTFPEDDDSIVDIRVEAEDVTNKATYLVLDLDSYTMEYSSDPPDVKDADEYEIGCRRRQLWLRRVEPGTFSMGGYHFTDDSIANSEELLSPREITITKAYYIAVFETTQKQFEKVYGTNPSFYKHDTTPVDNIYYYMLRGNEYNEMYRWNFFYILRNRTGGSLRFDLPTEAQWEMACRSKGDGTFLSPYEWNNGVSIYEEGSFDRVGSACWNSKYNYDEGNTTREVGLLEPSLIGLYDMHGNIAELCLDCYKIGYREGVDPKPVTKDEATDLGILSGIGHSARGGCWRYLPTICTSTSREPYDGRDPATTGFRIVLNGPNE